MITYTWDIRAWIERNLPVKRRLTKFIAWIFSLLKPLEFITADYFTLARNIDFKTKYNSQQKVLASLLNQLFDPVNKGISVATFSDAFRREYDYYRTESANPRYIKFRSEGATPAYDRFRSENLNLRLFRVYVPTSLSGSEVEIIAWLDTMKLAGTTYEIVYY